ncbi:MAG: thioredoxin domain-containing protein [Methanobacteriaceae archaeon]
MTDKKRFTNHLENENSPYLLQHVHNPVDWYPWGEEAFQKAENEDKPIFLSIGYSTCHWCHVMARESFQDEGVGEIMNQYFVAVKVDREERPDIDSVYMTVCQMMTGSGGWPLTIILTPQKEPFFAGTYFPRDSMGRGVGLKDLLLNVRDLWKDKKDELLNSAQDIKKALTKLSQTEQGPLLSSAVLDQAYQALKENFDQDKGGFGGFQKFPTPHHLLFLLRYWKNTGQDDARQMVETTLDNMIRGGVWDQVGYGFHRYAVDPNWLVPHFEKMLYDQALICLACTECYQATGNPLYQETAEKILEYVLRDMRSLEGGFYSAEDADSEGVEGKFYVWSHQELEEVLDLEELELAGEVYHITREGNFKEESTGQPTGLNILHLEEPLPTTATRLGLDYDDLKAKLDLLQKKLFRIRERRVHPHKDDKILTDWNGLLMVALARACQVFNKQVYREAAQACLDFVIAHIYHDGRLWHRYREGEVKVEGNLDDYSFLIWGLLELHQATLDSSHLKLARELNQTLLDYFLDPDGGGFYFTAQDAERVLVRKKEAYDAAIPSGNSVAYLNLLRLSSIMEDQELKRISLRLEMAFASSIQQAPTAFSMFLAGLQFRVGASFNVVISGEEDDPGTKKMIDGFRETYLPLVTLLLNTGEDDWLKSQVESLPPKVPLEGKTTAYVCGPGTCHPPTQEWEDVLKILERR